MFKNYRTILGTVVAASVVYGGTIVPAAAQPTGQLHLAAERSPNLRKALRALNNAATALRAADHDSAGHREKALDLVQHAIDECKQAIRDDR